MDGAVGKHRRVDDAARHSNQVWRRAPGTLTRYTPRSVVMSTEISRAPICVSGVAMLVWICMHDEPTLAALVERVAEASALPAHAAEAATLTALRELAEVGAVVSP